MTSEQPTVGIIIPCYNEVNYIEKCINSILQSTYPIHLIKVYVCDGMSTDGTREKIASITTHHPNITLIDNPRKVTPIAMNLGLKKSAESIKIILGAHAEIDCHFVENNVQHLNQLPEAGCVGGIIKNVYENELSRTIGLAMSSPFGVGNARFRTGGQDGFVDTVAFGAYRAEVFDRIGYFDERLVRNQDDELNYRLTKSGYKIYFSTDILSNYYVRSSRKKLWKQYYQYGYWKVFVNQLHQTITTVRQLIPFIFVTGLLVGIILSLIFPIFVYPLILGLFLYLASGYFFAFRLSKSPVIHLQIISIFFLLHCSYGLGYLIGIIDFLLLRKNPSHKNTEISR